MTLLELYLKIMTIMITMYNKIMHYKKKSNHNIYTTQSLAQIANKTYYKKTTYYFLTLKVVKILSQFKA